ncbi:MAG: methyltransferase domain-containing protein [Casimicrobiaceae bacterium]
MPKPQIRFNDGAAYEAFMGKWSQITGETFLQWLAPSPGLRWIDVGCGNGAFTELLVDRCSPSAVEGLDPSAEQLAFALTRPASRIARFSEGDALALPFPDASFDAAVMALVIFFVPDPARGVAEMARVVRPGGSVSAFAWDILGGGFPAAPMREEMRALGFPAPLPPSVDASRIDAMKELWKGAGLEAVETRDISVQRSFVDFDDFWRIALTGPAVATQMATMKAGDLEVIKERVRARFPADSTGRITCSARANAVKGLVPR